MEFGSHLDATVLLARDLVNGLTPGWSRGHEVGPVDEPAVRDVVTTLLADRPNRARTWREAPVEDLAALRPVAARLREVFEAVEAGDLDRAAGTLNDVLGEVRASPELTDHDGQAWHLHFHAAGADPVAGLTASLATALAMVVGSDARDRLGVCQADACDRVHVDTTRNASKRFCSSSCQNRAKTAAFRARRRGDA
ncbi:MAG: CGNR zinc finger domain-containing protein [Actinobacteria bacterium]|nr:CGNR zinc finger domain-containing protein [Actinomycetota bacterium]